MEPVLIPGLLAVAATVWAVALGTHGVFDLSDVLLVLPNALLVCVTLGYVMLTRQLVTQGGQTSVTIGRLVCRTGQLAEATAEHARTAQKTLLHLQRPVLILRVLRPIQQGENEIRVQVQNVGEGAAVWPKAKLPGMGDLDNLLGGNTPPHILPPGQFGEGVDQRQHMDVPVPESDEVTVALSCEDPRTGGNVPSTWSIKTHNRTHWHAGPVGAGAEPQAGQE